MGSELRRVLLGLEIVAAYLRSWAWLRGRPIAAAIEALRGSGSTRTATATASQRAEARRLAGAVSRVLDHLPGDTRCLRRSLVLLALLSRRGIPAKLVIGARAGPDFLAHAWIEYDGEAVLPADEASFARLVEL